MRSTEQRFIAECAEFLANSKVTIKMGRDNPDIDFACLHFYVTVNGENVPVGTYPFMNYIGDIDPDDDGYNF